MNHRLFLIGIILVVLILSINELSARKVGLSYALPSLENVSNPNFSETYLILKIYDDLSKNKDIAKFNGGVLVNPCSPNEMVSLHGAKNDPNYLLTLSDFTCDSSYRISFYVREKNQSAIKVSGLEALRSRNLIADESRNKIFEFTQIPVAVKPLWKNQSKNQISLRTNQKTY